MRLVRWDERIARARYLADGHSAAANLLTFYVALAEYQRSLAERWAPAIEGRPSADSLLESLETALVLDEVPEFLSWLAGSAPERLVAGVTAGVVEPSEWRALLDQCLSGRDIQTAPVGPAPAFVLEALVQPLAEQLCQRWSQSQPQSPKLRIEDPGSRIPEEKSRGGSRCPFCDSLPVVGVLREEGHGMKRSLLCALCLSEWSYLRLVCPACGEQQFDALPVYTAEQFSTARVEGCNTCRVYLKTIDLTKDGLAVPLVDDLATVALDLWARDQAYLRLCSNLLRT